MMDVWSKFSLYGKLSNESLSVLKSITKERSIAKNDLFLSEGAYPKTVAFVISGLFSQNYITANGETIIKKFFPEGSFMASLSSLITQSKSVFSFKALEPSVIAEFSFPIFKDLVLQHSDLAIAYINYVEKHWIVEKEPLEISYRHESATSRYLNFLKDYPGIELRVKQHEVASYLGITPTQLSRIRAEIHFS